MDALRGFYYNPKTGLISVYNKKEDPLKSIESFIKQQEIKKQVNVHQTYKPITGFFSNDQLQIDLIDFSKYLRWDYGFKCLLCVIDVISRKAFVSALKSKSNTTEE